MSQIITCPQCQNRLRFQPEMLGKKVKCAACNDVFVAGGEGAAPVVSPAPPPAMPASVPAPYSPEAVPPASAPEPAAVPPRVRSAVADDMPAATDALALAKPATEEARDWRGVRSGMMLHIVANFLYFFGVAFVALYAMVQWADRAAPPSKSMALALVFALAALVINWVLRLIGACFWLQAPGGRTRGPALASLVLDCLVVLLLAQTVFFTALASAGRNHLPGETVVAGLVFPGLLEIARLSVYPFFLNAVGHQLRSKSLAGSGMTLGVGSICIFTGLTLLNFFIAVTFGPTSRWDRSGEGVFPMLVFVNLLATLVLLVWGGLVLGHAYAAIRTRMKPSPNPFWEHER